MRSPLVHLAKYLPKYFKSHKLFCFRIRSSSFYTNPRIINVLPSRVTLKRYKFCMRKWKSNLQFQRNENSEKYPLIKRESESN